MGFWQIINFSLIIVRPLERAMPVLPTTGDCATRRLSEHQARLGRVGERRLVAVSLLSHLWPALVGGRVGQVSAAVCHQNTTTRRLARVRYHAAASRVSCSIARRLDGWTVHLGCFPGSSVRGFRQLWLSFGSLCRKKRIRHGKWCLVCKIWVKFKWATFPLLYTRWDTLFWKETQY